ncbi:MAG: hypothetical protein Q9195_009591 [Heterodermia aff. obscurata]
MPFLLRLQNYRRGTFQLLSHTSRLPLRYANTAPSNFKSLATLGRIQRWRNRILWLSVPIAFFGGVAFVTYVPDEPSLNPEGFIPFTLVAKEAVSSTSSVFTLSPRWLSTNAQIYDQAWKDGVWSVQVKQPQLQIARSYTPLSPMLNSEQNLDSDLRLLIRRDPQGEVSGYLHRLPVGAEVELRGPHLEYAIPNDVEEVVFLAGGTGIAPALQVVHHLNVLNSPSGSELPRIRILWANRRREDALGLPTNNQEKPAEDNSSTARPYKPPSLLARENLQQYYQGELSLQYFNDDQESFITEDVLAKCFSDSVRQAKKCPREGSAGRKLILVSGPDGFVNYYAGPKVWQGGVEHSGPLGGILKRLNLSGWEVWKL